MSRLIFSKAEDSWLSWALFLPFRRGMGNVTLIRTALTMIPNALTLLFSLLFLSIQATDSSPVSWSWSAEKVAEGVYDLVFTADIETGWTVYSQFLEDGGPVPTTLIFENLGGANLEGDAKESGHKKEGNDPLFGINVIKYLSDEEFKLVQRITGAKSNQTVTGYLTFMCCDDEKCLPPTDVDFSFDLSTVGGGQGRTSIENMDSSEKKKSSESPVQWTYSIAEGSGDSHQLTFTADIETGWTVYSMFIDEGGPIPTSIYYENPANLDLIGEATEVGDRKAGYDKIFDMDVVKFRGGTPYQITQDIRLVGEDAVAGFLTYMACDDKKCLAPTDVEFSLTTGTSAVAPVATATGDGLKMIDQVRPMLRETYVDPMAACGEADTKDKGLLWTYLFGFIGGLLALLTPCVFPMIPLTVSFFTKDTKRKGWVNASIYAL
ncbi:MAG: hypothetical protein AAFR14_09700, partial [Bacteroidota bacterium]